MVVNTKALVIWCLIIPLGVLLQPLDSDNVLQNAINQYVTTKQKPEYLQNAVNNFFNTTENASCSACIMAGNGFLTLRKSGASSTELKNFIVNLCATLTNYENSMCKNYVDLVLENILFIVDKKTDISIKRICAIQLQEKGCVDDSYIPWNINIPEGKSIPLPDEGHENVQNAILHLTDIHFDLMYESGSLAICNETLCCQRNTSGEPSAGYWGDYNCDMPWYSVENFLTHIKRHHTSIDYIYFTGDIINHKLWDTSDAHNTHYIKKLMHKLFDTFGNIPIYPVLGNHEVHPVDFFSTVNENFTSTRSLYNLVADEWSKWLPLDTKKTILKGGYYTVLVKPHFRIIGLNNNVCILDNIWLAFNENDPYEQLQWLADTLLQAEKNRETVHILAHIPPGHTECFKQWSIEFVKIINRFHNTITGQFYGHTHRDELKVFYNSLDWKEVTNVAFISGSFTSLWGLNPSYRVYYTEPRYNRVVDYDQWMYDLSETNKNLTLKPNWFKLYSFKEAYGVTDMTLPSFNKIIQSMMNNLTTLQMYERFRTRNSSSLLVKKCTKECLTGVFCSMTNVNYEDSPFCETLKKLHSFEL